MSWLAFSSALLNAQVIIDDSFDNNDLGSNPNGVGAGFNSGTFSGGSTGESGGVAEVEGGNDGSNRAQIASQDVFAANEQFAATATFSVESFGRISSTDSGTTRLFVGMVDSAATGGDGLVSSGVLESGVSGLWVALQSRENSNGFDNGEAALVYAEGGTRTTLATWTWNQDLVEWDNSSNLRSDRIETQLRDPISISVSADNSGFSLVFSTEGSGTLPPNVSGVWADFGITNDLSAARAAAYLQGNLGNGSHLTLSAVEVEREEVNSITVTSSTDSALATASIADDLLQTSLASTSWPSESPINSGTTGSFNENTVANPAVTVSEGIYDFNLDLTASPGGYDISRINSFSGWLDSRAGQRYTVFFSTVGSSSFESMGTAVDVEADGESLVTSIFDSEDELLGSGVDVIRFVVEANGLTNVWREIDVIGIGRELAISNFTVTPEAIVPGTPVTFDWSVSPSATMVLIDQGIGDVTALTDENGQGSITLDPGPLASTTYTLAATVSQAVTEEITMVTVTEQPIIGSFDADEAFGAPGEAINLVWNAQNFSTVTLNGLDVSGQSSLTVNPVGQERYVLVAENANGIVETEIVVFGLSEGQVIISEFSAINNGELEDEDGDFSDWIEIFNPTLTAANLADYLLTDDVEDLQKWSLPAVTIAPGEYLVVFASGKNRFAPNSELHTNFSLSGNGEYLALIAPNGVTRTTEFTPEYPSQRGGFSYGYDFDASGFRFFDEITPEAANEGSFMGFVSDTSFSIDRGFYDAPFDLVISSNTSGAEIRYTIDGSEPGEMTGLVYGPDPITISETTVIRAAAFKEGFLPTNIDTQSYIFPDDVVEQPAMRDVIVDDNVYGPQVLNSLSTIPTISLSFEGTDIDRSEIPISVELMNFEDEAIQLDAGAARFGSFATNFEKRSFRLHFRSQYGESRLNFPLFSNRDYPVLPVETFDSLDIRAGNHDMNQRGAYLGNRFADDSMLDMGHVAPHGRFVNIYFNGLYHGMYHLRERWDAAMLSDYLPGDEDEFDTINANNASRTAFFTGDLQDGDLNDWNQILSNLVNEPRFTQVRDLLDLNNLLDFMILFTWGTCESEFRAGGSVDNGEGFKFFLKDADGFFQPDDDTTNPPRGDFVQGPAPEFAAFFRADHQGPLDSIRLLMDEDHPDFRTLLADRIHRQMFNDGAMTPEQLRARYTFRRDEAQLPYFSEIARWGSHVGRANRTPEAWAAYHESLLDDELMNRTAFRVQLYRDVGMYPDTEAPVYGQQGGALPADGSLSLSVPEAVSRVYYITGPADTDPDIYVNSLDPRLPGGAVSASANMIILDGANTTQINLSEPGWVLARSFDDDTGEWSALTEAFFTIDTVPADATNLMVSKIHYNPADPTEAELGVAADNDEFEFIELMNVGSQAIDLTGVAISGGVTFDFGDFNTLDAGQRLIIPENREAFEVRYASSLGFVQFATDLLGENEYGGSLSNDGETLIITDDAGEEIQQFTYDDNSPWPTASDGGGYALVLRNPGVPIPDHSVGENWAASAFIGGSPGGGSEVGFIGNAEADQDGDGLNALLEYVLGSSDTVANDSALSGGVTDLLINGEVGSYLTLSFQRNQHSQNAFRITAEISSDLVNWEDDLEVVLVSEVDNGNGTSAVTYRSAISVGANLEEREFIRIIVTESP